MSAIGGGDRSPYPPVQNGKEKRPGLVTKAQWALWEAYRLLGFTAADKTRISEIFRTHIQATGNANAAVVTGTFTPLFFTAEIGDALGEFNPATGIFIPALAGVYTFATFSQFTAIPNGIRQIASLFENGVEIRRLSDQASGVGGLNLGQGGSVPCLTTAGASYTIQVLHNNAVDLNLVNAAAFCWLHVSGPSK